jgi:hypothetical protein
MAKTPAERQRERRNKLKEEGKYADYKKKQTEQKKASRLKKKDTLTEKEKEMHRVKDKIRHRNYRLRLKTQGKSTQSTAESPSKAFGNRQALGKAMSRMKKNLPSSPRKRSAVVKYLVQQYSPELVIQKSAKHVRSDAITPATTKLVIEYYMSDGISSQAPGMKDYSIVRDPSDGTKTKFQRRYLQVTLGEAYNSFKERHEGIKIGFSRFAEMRPRHVLLRHETPENLCLCVYHENVRLLLSSSTVFKNTTTEFVKTVVCDDGNEKCMLQQCNNCKDLQLFRAFVDGLSQEDLESEIHYKQWAKTDSNKVVRISEEGCLKDACRALEEQLPYFLWHVYVKRSQADHFDHMKKNLDKGTLLIQADFSENFSHSYQDEIQSAHWVNTSSTLYTAMVYYVSPTEEGTSAGIDPPPGRVKSEPYVVISDYMHHDKYAVIKFNKLILEKFKDRHPGFNVSKIEYQSDGTSQHFKQKYTLYAMTMNTVPTNWHFSATSHGKGCIDGIGGTVKRRVREKTRAKKQDLRTSLDFSEAAKEVCPNINVIHVPGDSVEREKEELEKMWIVADSQREIHSISGTRKAHCFRSCGPGVVLHSLISHKKSGVMFNFITGESTDLVSEGLSPGQEGATVTVSVLEEPSPVVDEELAGRWVKVEYDGSNYIGQVLEINGGFFRVRCLQEVDAGKRIFKFEPENQAVWYEKEKSYVTLCVLQLL